MSNIKETKDGLVEKSTGRKIKSPLDVEPIKSHTMKYVNRIIIILAEHGYVVYKFTGHDTQIDLSLNCPPKKKCSYHSE